MLILIFLLAYPVQAEEKAPHSAFSAPMPYARRIDLNPMWTASRAISWRFDKGSKTEFVFGSSLSAVLFSLSLLNIFSPSILPKGMHDALRGQGRAGADIGPIFGGGTSGIGGVR